MKTDRELLELAAKAAGIKSYDLMDQLDDCGRIEKYGWNPLQDDSDALPLSVKLNLHVFHNDPREDVLWVSAVMDKTFIAAAEEFLNESDRLSATRRAIVRAAAALQESKEAK